MQGRGRQGEEMISDCDLQSTRKEFHWDCTRMTGREPLVGRQMVMEMLPEEVVINPGANEPTAYRRGRNSAVCSHVTLSLSLLLPSCS